MNKSAKSAYNEMSKCSLFVYYGHGQGVNGKGRTAISFRNCCGETYGAELDSKGNTRNNAYLCASEATLADVLPNNKLYAVDNMSSNSLADMKMALYIACCSGDSYTVGSQRYNLVDSTYNKGAHFALGLKGKASVGLAQTDFTYAIARETIYAIDANPDKLMKEINYHTSSTTLQPVEFYIRGDRFTSICY